MFHDLTPEMAGLVGNWCTTLLYGVSVVAYFVCMYLLISRRHDRAISTTWILIGTSTAQFALATLYTAMGLRLLIEGFIHTEGIPQGAFFYWINPTLKTQLVAKAVYVTNTIVADCVLVWRLYIVWGKNIHVCVIPIITTCCCIGTGYLCIAKYGRITGNITPTTLFSILNWMIVTWSLSMATQLFSTAMIAGRIWWHAKHQPVSRSRYLSIIAIIVESGAVFTLSSAFLLVTAVLKTQAGEVLADIATQFATIIPALIIIRFELARDSKSSIMIYQDHSGAMARIGKAHTACRGPLQREEPSVQVTVSTLATSTSENEMKYHV